MNRSFTGTGLLALALLVAACGTSTSPTSPLAGSRLKVLATVSGPAAGHVGFRIGLENATKTTKTLNFSNGQFFDIEISDRGGTAVWRWSHDKLFVDVLWDIELEAGEAYVQDAEWDLKDNLGRAVPSGTYTCRVWITNSPRDEGLVTETSLTI